MNYLSNAFMTDLLGKVQQQQLQLLSKGFSAHLDANFHENFVTDGNHITFTLAVFEGNDMLKTYDFEAHKTEEQLNATLALLTADVNAM